MSVSTIAELLAQPVAEVSYAEQLSEAEQRQLAALIQEALDTQAEHMKVSAEQAASHLPRLLRGPFKRMFKA